MRTCIYCLKEKEEQDFSFEHVIPQCIGGAAVPDYLKTHDVCRKCNSNLGLFVDAGFEKSWFVSKEIQANARNLFNPLNPTGLPLICMGPCELAVPHVEEDEVCEFWLGPFGEQIYWIRPKDNQLYWYDGGNPRTTKSVETRAYYLFSVNSHKNIDLAIQSFKDSFHGKKLKKIICTELHGATPAELGFDTPDTIDLQRITFLNQKIHTEEMRQINLSLYINFDLRFLAKLAIGISHCLPNNELNSPTYKKELHKALWHRPNDEAPAIKINTSFSTTQNLHLLDLMGIEGGIVIAIIHCFDSTIIGLNIGQKLDWKIKASEHAPRHPETSKVLILFHTLGKCIELDFNEFIAYKIEACKIPELDFIKAHIENSKEYFKLLQYTTEA